MALFGSMAAAQAQAPHTPGFATAFAYLEGLMRPGADAHRRLAGIAPGGAQRMELGGGVFAIEQVYESKARVNGFFESHRKFIDVQVVVEGEEVMEVIDASRIVVREPYQPERDLITYLDVADASQLRVCAGEAAIFFPVDVHMPSLRLDAVPRLVRKSVVKIPVE
jgi:biofilm protein TabA